VAEDLKSDREPARRVQSAILIYLLVFVGMNLYVWIWFAIHRHGPHHFPLGERVERFGDLLRFSGKYQIGKDPRMVDSEHLIGTLYPKNYPPFSVVIYLFLLQVCAPYALPIFIATVIASVATACFLLWRTIRRYESYRWYMGVAIFATGLLGWGTEQTIMRGNIEGIMWIGVCLGAVLYARRQYPGAAMAFGVSCCLKPYPVLWLALMARHRKYREVTLGLLTAAAVTLASLLVIDPNPLRAYRQISGRSTFFELYIVAFRPMDEMMGDHSLLQTMKTFARIIRNHGLHFRTIEYWMQPNDPLAWKLYHAYLPLAAILGLAVLWGVWNKPALNQIFAVACVSTVLPLVAADYTLTVLLIPMGFFLIFLLEDVASGASPMSLAQMLWFLLPCAWIMTTEPLNVLHGVAKCIAILVLLGASTVIPLPSTLFGETTEARNALHIPTPMKQKRYNPITGTGVS
jgi:Glycosyltransferase family 87